MKAVRRRDAVLPVALALLGTVELLGLGVDGLASAICIEVLACALLVARRRHPWALPTAAGVLVLTMPYFGPELDEPAVPILVIGLASWTLARHLPDLRGIGSVGLFLLVILSTFAFTTEDPFQPFDVIFILIMMTPPYLAGLGARSLSEHNARLAAQAAELLRLQETVRVEAAAAERGRIARELHDVIAHSVSAMVVQASAASDLVTSDPHRAREAIAEVTTTGRRALAETGRLLHLIRDADDELGLAPDPGLEQLPALVDGFRRNGFDVELDVDGSLAGLPAGIDLSGYRIVQEALTNAAKHGRDQRAHVTVRRRGGALRIHADNAAATDARARTSGLGLVGMAERVSVFGGTLSHGLDPDGRWVLAAELPLPESDA